ncbi:MAG: hypothetical protein ACFFDQ_14045, partial [Candidatus Thorarchaeota archaeon]
WTVSIPGNELGIGLHTATVSAWLYGYTQQTNITSNLNVTVAANSFLVSWEPWELDASFVDIVNVSVVYTQDFLPIIGATVELTINGTTYFLTYSATDGMWHFSFRASDIGLGLWNVTVTANKTGYADGWDSRLLTISPAITNLTVIKSTLTIFYDEDITINIYYKLLNGSIVPGAVLTLEIGGIAQVAIWEMDHWTLTRSGNSMGIGVHPAYVHTTANGYQAAIETFDISVIEIPTTATTPSSNITIFAYESPTVSVTWIDSKNILGIAGFIPVVTWLDLFSVVDHGNGTYSIQIESSSLHVGNYELHVEFVRTGYENGTFQVNINILELPIVLIYDSDIHQYENESISIQIQMIDGPHASIVDWGEIAIELEGVQYFLVYDSELEKYSIDIWLSILAPGDYTLNFTASAIDCETEYGEIQLEIVPKISYILVLEADEQILGGQSTRIIITATNESGPVSGLTVTFHVTIQREQGATQERAYVNTTNSEGVALVEFDVPADATSLTIWANFEGSISEWPSISNTINRDVTSSGIDILSFIFSLFSDPLALALILGTCGLGSGLIIFRRRRSRPRIEIPLVTEDVVLPPIAPTAPAGEMDILMNEIKQYPVGLTRSQIAKALDISQSKAGVLVRKLLASDPRFEEISEGRLRRIRFKIDD